MVLDNHFANIQILKNQRHLLQQCISKGDVKATYLIEETDNILRQITNGKYKA